MFSGLLVSASRGFGDTRVFVGLSIAALASTFIVAMGLYFEYERHELRIFGVSKTTKLKGRRTAKLGRPSRKKVGSALVVAGVALEFIFGFGAFVSATIRESQNEERIASLDKEAANLNSDNLKLEKVLQPRRIPQFVLQTGGGITFADSRVFEKAARQFSEVSLVIQYVPDIEAIRLTDDLIGLAIRVSWKVRTASTIGAGVLPLSMRDGVTLYTWGPPHKIGQGWPLLDGRQKPRTPDGQAYVAANKLEEYLKALDIEASALNFDDGRWGELWPVFTVNRQPGDIFILVGSRPIEQTLGDLEWSAQERTLQKERQKAP